MVGHRAGDHALEQVFAHAHGAQAGGQAQAGVHRGDGLGDLGALVVAAGQAHRLHHALQAALAPDALGAGVEAHHGRQEDGVQRAVVQPRIRAAQAVR